jgi:hypothetical protein
MLPHAVFVSSEVTKDQKAPLALAPHEFSGNHGGIIGGSMPDVFRFFNEHTRPASK